MLGDITASGETNKTWEENYRRMRLVLGGWACKVANRHPFSLLTGHLRPKDVSTHHLTPVPLCQDHTHARPYCVAHPLLTGRVAASKVLLPREPSRCNHTGGRECDQVTTSTEKHSSSSNTSCESSLAREVLEHWTQSLNAAQIPEAELSTQHIVAHIMGVTRSELQRQSTAGTTLTREQIVEVDRLMKCRLARMPVQYILGEWDFHHITLKVVPPVFIPRSETEQLVELAIRTLKEMESPRVLEICCGSGAISLALLHSLPQVECVAVDQSTHAVQLTEANAVQLGLKDRLTVVKGKVTKDTRPSLPHSTYDLVVSNPPYVLRKDLMGLQPEIMLIPNLKCLKPQVVRDGSSGSVTEGKYEDLRALDGGNDGLDVIKAVLHHANQTLRPGRTLLLEVDPCHPYLLPAWLQKQSLDLKLLQVHQDFNKMDRFMEFIKDS